MHVLTIFFLIYLLCWLSNCRFRSISSKLSDVRPKTPSVLKDKLTNFTLMKFDSYSLIRSLYFWCLRLALTCRLDSNPTVSSRIYKHFFPIVKRRSGRKLSPVTADGFINPGKSTYSVEFWIAERVDARKFKTESCRHVYRPSSKYVLHPATTWRSVSGCKQEEQSEVDDSPHFNRFFRVGSALLIYRTVKLKMFFGSLLWADDHRQLNVDVELSIILRKNEPCEIRWFWSLSSFSFLIALSTCFVSL